MSCARTAPRPARTTTPAATFCSRLYARTGSSTCGRSGSVVVMRTALALLLFIPQASVTEAPAGASRRSTRAVIRPSVNDSPHTVAATASAATNSTGSGWLTKGPRTPLALMYVSSSEPSIAAGTAAPSRRSMSRRGSASRHRIPAPQGSRTPVSAKLFPAVCAVPASVAAYSPLSSGHRAVTVTGMVRGLTMVDASTRPTVVG